MLLREEEAVEAEAARMRKQLCFCVDVHVFFVACPMGFLTVCAAVIGGFAARAAEIAGFEAAGRRAGCIHSWGVD